MSNTGSEQPVGEADGDFSLLVVDDHDMARRAICTLLEQEGVETYESLDGAGALATFEESSADIDCALVDVSLPDGAGTELVDRLRTMADDLPVVFISGLDPAGISDRRALEGPRTRFLRKPVDPEHLLASLRKICR